MAETAAARETYRHGDLRRALIDAGVALARHGGPAAVVLREATRRAGVVPNAAYRHFANRDDLLAAVRMAALAELAATIEGEMAAIDGAADAPTRARAQLRAVGLGYLAFANHQPGLFQTAFFVPPTERDAPRHEMAGPGGLDPLQLLCAALDAMVAAGLLAPERRAGAEVLAWSSVHGFADLVVDGPLSGLDEAERHAFGERIVGMVERGL